MLKDKIQESSKGRKGAVDWIFIDAFYFGYKWDTISESVNEGMNQIVFLNDGKVVCYLYGYPENNGYGISFESENYKNAKDKDDLNFQVERSDSLVYLKN
ncbi:hypothetical protein ACIQ4Z_13855 [Peribacillus asahii]|uniref:hypothetical protein n=1 Tax=Peribacillus asahii TaxID=228899 RepID=UPI003805F4A7